MLLGEEEGLLVELGEEGELLVELGEEGKLLVELGEEEELTTNTTLVLGKYKHTVGLIYCRCIQ